MKHYVVKPFGNGWEVLGADLPPFDLRDTAQRVLNELEIAYRTGREDMAREFRALLETARD
jgi:hypothetical protein